MPGEPSEVTQQLGKGVTMTRLRVASFNVENLFERAKVFNFWDHSIGDDILEKIDQLRGILAEDNYTDLRKQRILELYDELKEYIEIREDRRKLFKRSGWAVVGVEANGEGDWDGTIEFKPAEFSEVARQNTAQVIKDVNPHIMCVVEAESRPTMQAFDAHLLGYRFRYEMLIDANDPRGIDVGLYSKYPLGGVWTHMFDKVGSSTVFSRDCLEVEVLLPNGQSMFVLCNHFKSRGYDYDGTADAKRLRQSTRLAEILSGYHLTQDWVIVCGDLNDDPTSAQLRPLLDVYNLHDVLDLQFPNDSPRRWTYHYNDFEQIDYILVSTPLKQRFLEAGVERRGIYELNTLTTASGVVDIETEYPTVTHWTNAASDHGAVWVDLDI
jgi:endonuclease/exonuclease/phosphatase family metal-dependent hydrolase